MPKSRNSNFSGNYIFVVLELARYVPLYSKKTGAFNQSQMEILSCEEKWGSDWS